MWDNKVPASAVRLYTLVNYCRVGSLLSIKDVICLCV